jgi:hypothetical protein
MTSSVGWADVFGTRHGIEHKHLVPRVLTVVAPTLLVTNTSAPFLTLNGVGAGVTDLLFHYPNQVKVTASAPSVYPYTIVAASAGTKVVRSFVTNLVDDLIHHSGRTSKVVSVALINGGDGQFLCIQV